MRPYYSTFRLLRNYVAFFMVMAVTLVNVTCWASGPGAIPPLEEDSPRLTETRLAATASKRRAPRRLLGSASGTGTFPYLAYLRKRYLKKRPQRQDRVDRTVQFYELVKAQEAQASSTSSSHPQAVPNFLEVYERETVDGDTHDVHPLAPGSPQSVTLTVPNLIPNEEIPTPDSCGSEEASFCSDISSVGGILDDPYDADAELTSPHPFGVNQEADSSSSTHFDSPSEVDMPIDGQKDPHCLNTSLISTLSSAARSAPKKPAGSCSIM